MPTIARDTFAAIALTATRKAAARILMTLCASLLLAAGVGTASARNLSISNQSIRVTWSRIEFSSAINIRCPVTLEGSFHTRTIAKVADSLVGAITSAIMNQERCTNGQGATLNGREPYNGTTSPNTLPWHLTYKSFAGTLPNITSLRAGISRFRFGITSAGTAGQYGNERDVISVDATREASGAITELTPVAGSNRHTLIRCDRPGLFGCPAEGRMVGQGIPTVLNSATRITITLI